MPTDWIQHFGLREDPFAGVGAEEPVYLTPQLNQRVNLILHLVQYSDLMLVVTGARGSGKTALIDHLLGDAGPRWRTCRIEVDAETDPGLLLSRVLAGFGLPERGTEAGDPLAALESYLQGLRKGALRPVLVVDEAHLLPTASLDPLTRLAGDRKRLGLAVVLFGEPPLLERVGRSVGSGLLHVIDIPALTEEQVSEYLDLRLGWAGLKGRRPFHDEAVRVLHKSSRGLPGMLNQAAAQFLANRAAAGPGGVIGALQIAGRWLARHRRLAAGVAGVVGVSVLAGTAAWLVAGREPAPPPATATIQLRPPQTAPAEPAPGRARDTRPPLVPPPSATYPPVSPDAARALQQQAASRPLEAPKPVPAPPEPPVPPRPAATPPAETTARTPAPTESARPAAPAPSPSQPEALRPDETWLMGQSAGNFTVQLFGSHDRQAAERFKESSKVKERLAVYRTSRDGKDWFVVVAGSFGSRDAAQRAIQNLPPELKRSNPWPRSLASVQDSIRQAPRRN
jgi:DamX protein